MCEVSLPSLTVPRIFYTVSVKQVAYVVCVVSAVLRHRSEDKFITKVSNLRHIKVSQVKPYIIDENFDDEMK